MTTGAVVTVTGICGRLGPARRALSASRPRRDVGLDRLSHSPIVPRTSSIARSISAEEEGDRKCSAIGRSRRLVHLGVMHDPRDSGEAPSRRGTSSASRSSSNDTPSRATVPKLSFLLSSANVYGPRPDNAQFLTEDAPLLAASAFSDMRDLVELDMLAQSFFLEGTRTPRR